MLRLIMCCILSFPLILYPMEMVKVIRKNSREFVQKKKKLEQPLLALQHYDFIKKILIIKELAEQTKLSEDLLDICKKYNIHLKNDPATFLINYSIGLENKKFEQTFHDIESWKDFQIPLSCHYLLTKEQLGILGAYFQYVPQKYTFEGCYTMRYYLNSEQEYQQFVTIPRILREYLIYLPTSHRIHATEKNREQGLILNPTKTLLIDLSPKNPKERPILPEENKKRTKSLPDILKK